MNQATEKAIIRTNITQHLNLVTQIKSAVLVSELLKISQFIYENLINHHLLYIMGNGGSAADAQHLAAELTNQFRTKRLGLPAIALTTDTSVITAIANDRGFDQIFSRQIEALVIPGDLVLAITTSDVDKTGHSLNLMLGLQQAHKQGAITIVLGSKKTQILLKHADYHYLVSSIDSPRIQESQLLVEHILCELIEFKLNEKF